MARCRVTETVPKHSRKSGKQETKDNDLTKTGGTMCKMTKIEYPLDLGDLSIHSRHNCTVARQLVRRDRVKIIVSVGGKIIGERMSAFHCLWALACYVDDPTEIARLKTSIQRLREAADLADAIQRRDPVALAQDAQNHGCIHVSNCSYLIGRAERIQLGQFAYVAKYCRKTVVRLERELDSAPTGPLNQSSRPYIQSWHQRYALALRRPYLAKFVDVIEIPTGLPAGITGRQRHNILVPTSTLPAAAWENATTGPQTIR